MDKQIIQCICDAMFVENELYVKGLGTFCKTEVKAIQDYTHRTVSPPQKKLVFDISLVKNEDYLATALSKKFDLSLHESTSFIVAFSQGILEGLQKDGQRVIGDLGKFYGKPGGSIHFISADSNFDTETFGLPKLDLIPIDRPLEGPAKLALQEKRMSPSKSRQGRRLVAYLPIVVAGLICIGVLGHYILSRYNHTAIISLPVSELRINQKPEKTAEPVVLGAETKKDLQDSIDPIAEKAKASDEQTTEPELVFSAKKCLVVAGSFGSLGNANNLKHKLQNMGYEAISIPHGKMNRVGIAGECGQDALQTLLASIQNDIEPNAWILNKN